jgi:hypothetical protein
MIDLSKVTISQFIAYCKLVDELQPELDKHFPDKTGITGIDLLTRYPAYVEAVVKFWTGWETVKDKDTDLVLGIFTVIDKLTVMPEPVALKAFEHEGEWYYAPADLQLLNKVAPMGKASFGQALEALQIEQLMQGKYEMIPYVLATLFLKDGETVDDFEISERAAIMERLPLTQAMNAYFFLARSASTWLKRINRYLEAKVMPKQPKPELVG